MANIISNGRFSERLSLFIVIVAGIAGGILLAQQVSRWTTHASARTSRGQDKSTMHVNTAKDLAIGVGDLFPLDSVEVQGKRVEFADILGDQRRVVVLISLGCERCDDLLDYLRLNLNPETSSNTSVLVGIDRSQGDLTQGYRELLRFAQLFRYDAISFSENKFLNAYPTIYCLDESGVISAIEVGFKENLDSAVISYLFEPQSG